MVELGLIGYPLGHSFSAEYFNRKFKEEEIDCVYTLFPMKSVDGIRNFIETQKSLTGLNVTIPHKESIIDSLDSISESAKSIGAVNVIAIERTSGKFTLTGHNTDWKGFSHSLEKLITPEMTSALVLGTGGAAKAVAFALKRLGIRPTFVSRNPSNFSGNNMSSDIECIGYEDIDKKRIHDNLLIVNTTPLGMHPDVNSCPAIPYEYVGSRHLCYDLVYNPEKTMFLELAEKSGAKIKNGLEMLHLQADLSWDIWQPLIDRLNIR